VLQRGDIADQDQYFPSLGLSVDGQVDFIRRCHAHLRHVLQIYFLVAHDPTELDRQGPDVGSQYRSAIFPTTGEQARVAQAYIDQLEQAAVFDAPIVTRIEPNQAFYRAEAYHQNYLARNPSSPYIMIYDLPKIENLKRVQPDVYRTDPVLVAPAASAR